MVRTVVLPQVGSELEETLAWQIRVAKLPVPEREILFAKEALGRAWRFDFAWPDLLIAAEVEGGTYKGGKARHTSAKGFEEDAIKYNSAGLLGWRVFRFTGDMVKDGRAIAFLETVFADQEVPEAA